MSDRADGSGAPTRRGTSWERHFFPELGASGAAREFAVGVVGPIDSRCDDVALVVSELASNAVLHARTPFSVRVTVEDTGRLRLEVRDASPVPPTRRHYSVDAVTGRGIRIVEAYADRWGVESQPDGKIVWCELDSRSVGYGVRTHHD